MKTIVLALAILTLSVAACANTVWVPNPTTLPAGWATSVVPDSGARGSITNKLNWVGSNGFQFTLGDANKTAGCRSILGTTTSTAL